MERWCLLFRHIENRDQSSKSEQRPRQKAQSQRPRVTTASFSFDAVFALPPPASALSACCALLNSLPICTQRGVELGAHIRAGGAEDDASPPSRHRACFLACLKPGGRDQSGFSGE